MACRIDAYRYIEGEDSRWRIYCGFGPIVGNLPIISGPSGYSKIMYNPAMHRVSRKLLCLLTALLVALSPLQGGLADALGTQDALLLLSIENTTVPYLFMILGDVK